MEIDKALNGLEAYEKVLGRIKDIQDNPCHCGNPLGNTNYHFIFMDCNMPIMDGFEATQKIRDCLRGSGEPDSQETKIIALTAYTT